MPLSYFTLFEESAHLSLKIWPLAFRYILDGIFALFTPRTNPALILQDEIKGVVTGSVESAPEAVGGAGGHGTERLCHTIYTSEKQTLHTFMKSRTSQFFESFFLNLFGVYANELSFYQFLKEGSTSSPLALLPLNFFPRVYVAKFSPFMSNFTLILEDVTQTRASSTTSVSFPCLQPSQQHPLHRVQAVLRAQAILHSTFCERAPDTVWGGKRSPAPRFLQLVARSTLRDVECRFPGVMSPEVLDTYRLFLDNYSAVRQYWSGGGQGRGRTTLVHGDSHLGNFFFEEGEEEGGAASKARMYDFQCTAREHPMRDVVYHVMSSVSDEVVQQAGGDRALIQAYLLIFNDNLAATNPSVQPMELTEAWFHYRLHACWVLVAWIISAGAGDKLFESDKARFILGNISRACDRVDIHQALKEFLESADVET